MKKEKVYQICGILIIIDQIIKLMIRLNLEVEEIISIIPGFFRIYYLQNTGAAFSSFSGMRYLLIIIGIISFIILTRYLSKNSLNSNVEVVSFGMILGGLVGNLVDRILYGVVIDYLSFTIFTYQFAVFNFADILIVVGVIVLIIYMIQQSYMEKQNSKP